MLVHSAIGLALMALVTALLWPQYDIAARRQDAQAGLPAIHSIQTAVVEYVTQHGALPQSPQALIPHGIPVAGARIQSRQVAEARFTEDGLIAMRYRDSAEVPEGLRGKWLHIRPLKDHDDATGIEFCVADANSDNAVPKRYWPISERTRRCPAE